MVFSSVVFLFFFLPLVLVVGLSLQWLANLRDGRGVALRLANAWLLFASLIFYAWGEVRLVWVLLFSCLLNYAGGLAMGLTGFGRRLALAAFVASNLGLLVWFKYSALLLELANWLNKITGHPLGRGFALGSIALPLGISFFTFHGISYVVDVARGRVKATRNLLDFACYFTLFPQLVAGPIVRFVEVSASLTQRTVQLDDLGEGARRFIIGLGKKTLIANQVSVLADAVFGLSAGERTASAAWLGLAAYALQIFFDFSGYSDMAVGLGRMFGFRLPENFYYPYAARSIREFWRRWHMTLTNFFRDYLYIPLGGNRHGPVRTALNLWLVFALCGLWHGASWNFLLWGFFHGFFLALERVLAPATARAPGWLRVFGHFYTLVAVLLGWVLFRCDTWKAAMEFYRGLFSTANPGGITVIPWNALAPNVLLPFAAGLVLCVPLGPILRWARLSDRNVAFVVRPLATTWTLVVLVLCLLAIGAGSHNPFIYYRF
jgi:alginate O-acetyltransferase complex protein AlgI